jgi:RNA polymerase sigma factor (sigma-70 family)
VVEIEHLRRFDEGDRATLLEIERRCGAMARSVAIKEFHLSVSDAEDVFQGILLSLMEFDYVQLRSYRGEAPICYWLCGIVRHRCLDHLRKSRSRCEFEEPIQAETALADYELERTIAVREALRRLSPRDQTLMRLFFFEGRSYKHIARLLGIGENTLGTWLFRAKVRLREILGIPHEKVLGLGERKQVPGAPHI